MMAGVIHEVSGVWGRIGGGQQWRVKCVDKLYVDGRDNVRVGQWTYPTCLECAGRP